MKKLFVVSKTYDIVTPESAEHGDYSESGFIFERENMTLRELLNELKELGGFDNLHGTGRQSLYAIDSIKDYYDGSETSYAIHVNGPKRALKRLSAILERI
jgi:hypothetical protein